MATPTVPANNIGIQPMFTTQNPTYTKPTFKNKVKLMLHSTATPGAPAQNFFNGWNKSSAQASVEFVLDNEKILQYMPVSAGGKNCYKTWHCGGSGNNTHIATECCEPTEAQLIPVNFQQQGRNVSYPRTYTIKRIQMELQALGFYTGEIDGSFGPATETAVKAYQTSVGLTADGIVGPNTFNKMRVRTGSYMAYDVQGATPFFNAMYNNAVALFGWLCSYVGAKPSEITCHADGHTAGIASNHADVNHFFPLHGKTMDDFRADVQKYVNGTWIPLGTGTVSNLDQDYLAAVEKLADAGIISTASYWENQANGATAEADYIHLVLQNSGKYFITKNFTYAVDVLTTAAGLTSPLYWKGAAYSEVNVRYLFIGVAKAVLAAEGKDVPEEMDYATALETCVQYGLISMPDYWAAFQDDDIYEDPFAPNVQSFMKAAARYFIEKDFTYGVDAVAGAIGMTSVDYWKNSASYSMTNVKYLFTGIAKAM